MVEDVECLGAELEVHFFVHRKALEETHVEVRPMRQGENVTPRVAVGSPWGAAKASLLKRRGPWTPAGCLIAIGPWIGPTISG